VGLKDLNEKYMTCFQLGNCKTVVTQECGENIQYGAGALVGTLRKCTDCGFQTFDPIPSPKQLSDFYSNQYWNDKQEFVDDYLPASKLEFVKEIQAIAKQYIGDKQPISIHDIGCSFGGLVDKLHAVGYQATGTDLSERSIELGKTRCKGDISSEPIGTFLKNRNAMIDIFVMNHSLEHCADPTQVIKDLAPFLSENGIFIIRVPNARYYPDLITHLARSNWYYYPTHLHYFTAQSCICLAESADMHLVDVKTTDRIDHVDEFSHLVQECDYASLPDGPTFLQAYTRNCLGLELQLVIAKQPKLSAAAFAQLKSFVREKENIVPSLKRPVQSVLAFYQNKTTSWSYWHMDQKQAIFPMARLNAQMWHAKNQSCSIAAALMIVSAYGSPIRRWIAPRSGTVKIEAFGFVNASHEMVTLDINHHGSNVASAVITFGAPQTVEYTIQVEAGEAIDFLASIANSHRNLPTISPFRIHILLKSLLIKLRLFNFVRRVRSGWYAMFNLSTTATRNEITREIAHLHSYLAITYL
jgi:2-polyprenyl-3-methyl-5-hydroxy-6-metoxy-1,4-benzoquinol methylase